VGHEKTDVLDGVDEGIGEPREYRQVSWARQTGTRVQPQCCCDGRQYRYSESNVLDDEDEGMGEPRKYRQVSCARQPGTEVQSSVLLRMWVIERRCRKKESGRQGVTGP
jgi:hypothetical protein